MSANESQTDTHVNLKFSVLPNIEELTPKLIKKFKKDSSIKIAKIQLNL